MGGRAGSSMGPEASSVRRLGEAATTTIDTSNKTHEMPEAFSASGAQQQTGGGGGRVGATEHESAGGGSGSLADQSYGSEPFPSPLGAFPGSVAQPSMPISANAPAASVASLACLDSPAPGWGCSVNNCSVNIPSNASISHYSSLFRLASVASSWHPMPAGGESVEGGRRGSAKGADSGAPRCHAANAFRSFVSQHSGMSGSVEGSLHQVQAEELSHNPVAVPHTSADADAASTVLVNNAALYDGIRSHRGTRVDHALVQVNAAPAGKRGSGGFPVGGGGPFPFTPPAHLESERPEKMLCQRAEGSGAHVRARPEMQLKARSGQVCLKNKYKNKQIKKLYIIPTSAPARRCSAIVMVRYVHVCGCVVPGMGVDARRKQYLLQRAGDPPQQHPVLDGNPPRHLPNTRRLKM